MNKITSLVAAVLVAGALTSCSSDKDEVNPSAGKARVAFDIEPETSFTSRGLDEADWKNAGNYTVEIIKENEVVGSYQADAIPGDIELEQGQYTVHAFCGAEHIASRNEFLSEGKEEFALNISDEQHIKVTCTPTCGKVVVNFGAEMGTYFSDYFVTFSTPKMEAGTEATWAKGDNEPWYLALGEEGDVVTATIHLTPNEQYVADNSKGGEDWSEGTVVCTCTLKRNEAWVLNINPNYTTTNGKLGISIAVDDSTNDHDVDVVIPAEWI